MTTPGPDAPLPTPDELHSLIERWRVTAHLADVARAQEEDARRAVVAALHRAGLTHFVL